MSAVTATNTGKLYIVNKNKLYAFNHSSNCKMSTIEGICALGLLPSKATKAEFDKMLMELRAVVFIHTINEPLAKFIESNYETYYSEKVPIGYGTGNQYHILIRNIASATQRDYARVKT